jgi:tetratricopeptide (TPR) repeat protein
MLRASTSWVNGASMTDIDRPLVSVDRELELLDVLAERACNARGKFELCGERSVEDPLSRVKAFIASRSGLKRAHTLQQAVVELTRQSLAARERVTARTANGVIRAGAGFGSMSPTPPNLVDLVGRGVSPGHALTYFRRCYRLGMDRGDARLVTFALLGLGRVHSTLGQRRRALLLLEGALSRAGDENDPLAVDVLRNLAEAYLVNSNPRRARGALRRAFQIAVELESRPLVVRTLRSFAELLRDGAYGDEHRPRALLYFMRAAKLAIESNHEVELGMIARAFSIFAEQSGDPVAEFLAEPLKDAVDGLFRRLRPEASYELCATSRSERAKVRTPLREVNRVSHLRATAAAGASTQPTTPGHDTKRSTPPGTAPSLPATRDRVA